MPDHPLNYEQITAAARQVIAREDARCQREFKLDKNYAGVDDHRNIAFGALALWQELTLGRAKQDDQLHLNGMVGAIGTPMGQR